MTQLSDTQAVILSAACARDGGFLLPIAANLKGGAVGMVLTSLIKKELAEEIPTEPGMPIWREDEDGNPLTLRATSAAYAAMGMDADTDVDTAPEGESAADMADQPETPPTEADTANSTRKTRQGTKQEALIAMLKQPEGASIAEALKKKLGLTITSEKVENRGRVYRIQD